MIPEINEETVVRSLLDQTAVDHLKVAPDGLSGWTLQQLQKLTPTESLAADTIKAIGTAIATKYPKGITTVEEAITALLPKFLYFGEYNKLPDTFR